MTLKTKKLSKNKKKYLCVIGNYYATYSNKGFIDYISEIYDKNGIIDIYIDTTVISEPTTNQKKLLSKIFYKSEICYIGYQSIFSVIFNLLRDLVLKRNKRYTDFLADGTYSTFQKVLLSSYVKDEKCLSTFCCTTPYVLYEIS